MPQYKPHTTFVNPQFFVFEPFAKVIEWLDWQESIEGDSLFPILRLKPATDRPPFVIPAKVGIQRWANGKTGGKLISFTLWKQVWIEVNRRRRDPLSAGGRVETVHQVAFRQFRGNVFGGPFRFDQFNPAEIHE